MKAKIALLSLSLALVCAAPVMADDGTNSGSLRGVRQQIREDIKDKIQAIRKSVAVIRQGKVTAINGAALTITADSQTLTINTDSNTKFFRRFGAKSAISEITVNDTINVIGLYTDDTKTAINARLIRDLSIQKRHGLFVGTVKSLTSGGLVLTPVARPDQAVTFSSTTKYMDRRQQTISEGDIKVGDRIRVRGVWDNTNNTITEVVDVKDYSLPMRPSSAATPTLAPTPTP